MLTALLLVASMGLAPAPVAVHPAPAAAASPASQPAQAADFAAWLGAEPAAAPSPALDALGSNCLTSCSQCPKQATYCCQPLETGCVTCSTHPILCTG